LNPRAVCPLPEKPLFVHEEVQYKSLGRYREKDPPRSAPVWEPSVWAAMVAEVPGTEWGGVGPRQRPGLLQSLQEAR
jgi:hypothetical protein